MPAARRRTTVPGEPDASRERGTAGQVNDALGTVGRIVVVGLGPSGPEFVPPAALQLVAGAGRAFLRTSRHPAAALFSSVESFDRLYDEAESFEEVYEGIVSVLVASALQLVADGATVAYAVPGSPLVAERTVELLRSDPRVQVTVVPALSFLDLAWERLSVDPVATSVRLIDGTRFAEQAAGQRGPLLVAQCWSTRVLSDIKLAVTTDGAGSAPRVTVLHHLGLEDERVEEVEWHEIDRWRDADHLTSLYVAHLDAPPAAELVSLDELVRTLRARCPWDKEQTHGSLARHLLEESYEVLEAIDALGRAQDRATPRGAPAGDSESEAAAHLEEELGDLLFQVYFHAALAAEEGFFNLSDVARGIREKLVARHPHVFGDVVAQDASVVVAGWERAKLAEKGRQSVADGIPAALPALARAAALQRKALVVDGLEHPGPAEERDELRDGLARLELEEPGPAGPAGEGLHDEVGRLLFVLSDLGRQLGVDPEEALRAAARRYEAELRQAEVH